jgi:hypothetical protein
MGNANNEGGDNEQRSTNSGEKSGYVSLIHVESPW